MVGGALGEQAGRFADDQYRSLFVKQCNLFVDHALAGQSRWQAWKKS